MSYSDEEVSQLKILLQDVLDENFLKKFLEMKDKLTKSQHILEDLINRVECIESELEFYHDCEDCKRINKIQHHAATQTTHTENQPKMPHNTGKSKDQAINTDEPKTESRLEDVQTQTNGRDLPMKRPRREEDQDRRKEIPVITID